MHSYIALALLLLCGLTPGTVHAATIRVAQDGSGDYEVIYDAVAAAASGDTISIAPGEYTETRSHTFLGGILQVIAAVLQDELTIIGDDVATVLIGKATPPPNPDLNLYYGLAATGNLRVSGVTIRNLKRGVDTAADWATVESCRFVGNFIGVSAQVTDHVEIRDCQFLEQDGAGIVLFRGRGATGDVITDCSFIDNDIGPDVQTQDAVIERCTMEGGNVGMQVSLGGIATVRECHFDGMSVGFAVVNAQTYMYDCEFEANMSSNVTVTGLLAGSGNELKGGSFRTLGFSKPSVSQFHGNHIINGGGWSVHTASRFQPLETLDLSRNYWGTTDTDQLDEWIWDHDDDSREIFIVDYSPLIGLPIPTESTSFGELKARYGGNE